MTIFQQYYLALVFMLSIIIKRNAPATYVCVCVDRDNRQTGSTLGLARCECTISCWLHPLMLPVLFLKGTGEWKRTEMWRQRIVMLEAFQTTIEWTLQRISQWTGKNINQWVTVLKTTCWKTSLTVHIWPTFST